MLPFMMKMFLMIILGINSGMVILRNTKNEYCNEYLYYILQSKFVQNQIHSIKTGSAQPQLPIKLLNKIN